MSFHEIGGFGAKLIARTIDPRRIERPRASILVGLMIIIPLACSWALVYLLVGAAAFAWRWVEPVLSWLAIGLALIVIILGLGGSW